MAAQVKDTAWMEWIAGLLGRAVRETRASAFPSDRFHCLLDELPVHLIPGSSSSVLQKDLQEPLFLNPNCLIVPADQLPEELISQPDLIVNFALQGTIAWVRGLGEFLLPFWIDPNLASTLRNLRPEQDARALMSLEDCRVLVAAGILLKSESPQLPTHSLELHEKLRKIYLERDYAVYPGLLHPFHVAVLRRYYRYLMRKGRIYQRDSQCPQRYVAHNEPVARFFHYQLTKVVSAVAGEPVKPSYVYFASYLSGAELKKHTDREQCEFSISLCLDFSPEPERETPWPLCLDTPEGRVEIHQALGDGLFYRGRRLPHYRDALGEGLTSTSIFFHYVSTSFTGSLA
ncbi:MAG TPA: hypothetical protein VIH89_03665 [Candidatus Sulfotelmatobacter sp.]|jgi:hypothetical protein